MVWFCLGLALFLVDSSSGWISSSRTTATSFWDTYKSSVQTVKKFGVNPTFNFNTGVQSIKSPLLLWSETRSWMNFSFELSDENPSLSVANDILCFRDLQGRFLVETWSEDVDLGLGRKSSTKGSKCIRAIDVDSSNLCRTFKVKTIIKVLVGSLTISDIQFGSESICSRNLQTLTTLECRLEDGDCGLQNDACGLVDWEIRSDSETGSRRDRSAHCYEQTGVPLLKKQIHETCSFENLRIVKLQRSGFTLLNLTADTASSLLANVKTTLASRSRRSSGYSLYLDPSLVTGVAIGVLDLPEVQHASANAYLTFVHDMVEGGLHDLMVTAVCTSDPAHSLIPLDGSLHYHKSNLDGSGSSGTICLDIHDYVAQVDCSTFVIQLQAAAIETVIIVDDIYFVENLQSVSCSEAENVRK